MRLAYTSSAKFGHVRKLRKQNPPFFWKLRINVGGRELASLLPLSLKFS